MSQQPDNIQTEQAAAKAVKNGKKKPEENLTMAQELYQTLQSLAVSYTHLTLPTNSRV